VGVALDAYARMKETNAMRLDIRERHSRTRERPRLFRITSWRWPAPIPLSHAQRALPWRAIVLQATGAWVATRLAYAVLTWYFPLITGAESPSIKPVNLFTLISQWTNWDGSIFIHIAQHGYWTPYTTVYFPLYPGAIRLVATLIGFHWTLAALIISNLSALLAFISIGALAAQIATAGSERQTAKTAVMLFAAYPLAFFLVAAYSDGLFAGLAALTLLFGLRRRWGWAALFGFLAVLSRPTAPALVLPLAWEAFQTYRERRAETTATLALRETAPALAAIAGPILGIGVFCAYLWLQFGDPLIFIRVESNWSHFSLAPVLSLPVAVVAFAHSPLASPLQMRVLLDLAPVLGAVVLTLVAARRAPVALTLYMLGLLYIVTSEPINFTDLFISGGRYMLAAVPLFVIFSERLSRSEWLRPMLYLCGLFLQAILAIYFLRHGWIV